MDRRTFVNIAAAAAANPLFQDALWRSPPRKPETSSLCTGSLLTGRVGPRSSQGCNGVFRLGPCRTSSQPSMPALGRRRGRPDVGQNQGYLRYPASARSAQRPATISASVADKMTSARTPTRGRTSGSARRRSVRTKRAAATTSSAIPTMIRASPW
jgi:hypothetical protein